MALTDVVLALYLEGLPRDDAHGSHSYSTGPLTEAAEGAFALGCALGVEFPDRVSLILAQTHPGEVQAIIDDCTGPLQDQVVEAREASAELEPALFMGSLFEALDEDEPVEADAACNILSIAFEYGCVLAHVERRGAQLVRNSFNRRQALAAQGRATTEATSEPPPPAMGPRPSLDRPVQELAQELLTAYEADIGFGQTEQ